MKRILLISSVIQIFNQIVRPATEQQACIFQQMIPIVDLDSASASNVIVEAFKTTGFVYIKNHGISIELLNEIYDHSKQFFNQRQEYKEALSWDSPESNRGYASVGKTL